MLVLLYVIPSNLCLWYIFIVPLCYLYLCSILSEVVTVIATVFLTEHCRNPVMLPDNIM